MDKDAEKMGDGFMYLFRRADFCSILNFKTLIPKQANNCPTEER